MKMISRCPRAMLILVGVGTAVGCANAPTGANYPAVPVLSEDPFALGTSNEAVDPLGSSMSQKDREKALRSPEYSTRRDAISSFVEEGRNRRLEAEEVEPLYDLLLSDPDWRIKVRVMHVFLYVRNKEKAQNALAKAIQDRDLKSSGGGNVPLYASRYLSEIGDAKAVPVIEEWIAFLTENPAHFEHLHFGILERSKQNLAQLQERLYHHNRR